MEGFSLKFQAGKEKMCIPFVYCNGNNVTTGNFPSESLTSVAVSLESMKKQRSEGAMTLSSRAPGRAPARPGWPRSRH